MRYLWELLLRAQEQKIAAEQIRFTPAKEYSPYLEVSQAELNNQNLEEGQSVEINPYLRFHSIFKNMFLPDMEDYRELRESLFQLMIHSLAESDLKQGMSRREYYKKFLFHDISQGAFGEDVRKNLKLFTIEEQNIIANGMLKMYSMGDSLELLQEMLMTLLQDIIIYKNLKNRNEILLYIGKKETKELEDKVELIIKLFANMKYKILIYYQYHFAVLGVDITCSIDEIALY